MSLTVATFCWSGGGRPIYTGWHVENLRRMFARYLTIPHRFICISDDPTVPGYWPIWKAPAVRGRSSLNNYVRLGLFGEPGAAIGGRILLCDLDVIVFGLLDELVTQASLKLWDAGRPWIQGGLVQLVGGSMPWLWAAAHNQGLVTKATEKYKHGTDQALLSFYFADMVRRGEIPSWTERDGISVRNARAGWRMYQAAASPKPWDPGNTLRRAYLRASGREADPPPPPRIPGPRRHRLHRARRTRIAPATIPAKQTAAPAPAPAPAPTPSPGPSELLRRAVARLLRR